MKLLAFLILVPVAFLIQVFWGGYVLSILWAWFLVPIGAMPITSLHAAGLQCILSVFLGSRGTQSNDDTKDTADILGKLFAIVLLAPAFGLFIGWLIKSMM